METGKMKLALSAGALALSMTLAGCGGGGGGTAATPGGNVCVAPQTGTYPDCKDPPPPGNSTADNNAAKVAGAAIGEHSVGGITDAELNVANITVNRFGGNAQITLGTQGSKDFAPDTDNPAPSAVTGWMGQAFSYSTETPATEERVVVYTNKAQATDISWIGSSGDVLQVVAAGVDSVATATDTNPGRVTFATFDDDEELYVGHFTGAFKLPDANSQGDATRSMPETTGNVKPEKGTFYGVPGEFSCATSGGCTITRTKEGMIRFAAGVTFDPDEDDAAELGKLKAKYAKEDAEYVSFGYWTKEETMGV